MTAEEPTYTVGELGAAMEAALRQALGTVWVRGEVAGLQRRPSGHVYFELVDEQGGAKVPVVLFSGQARVVDRQLHHAGLNLGNGVELRLRGEPAYYGPAGRLQLRMLSVDPVFTVGRLALSRERLLAALAADGTLERQQRLTVSALPLRIGLVTSVGSAAHHDVLQELQASRCGFTVVLADARVQGEGSANSVIAALRRLYRAHRLAPFDVVAIVRGGGSRMDLVTFDDAAVANAISKMLVPVWTGIGHETDTSVADAVAHTAFKTPTAVAAELRARAVEALAAATARATRLRAAVDARLTAEHRRLGTARDRLVRAQDGALAVHAEQARSRRRRLRAGVAGVLAAEDARLDAVGERLPRSVRRALDAEEQHLSVAARHVAALDPERVLARGFSVTRDETGRPITDAATVVDGQVLVSQVARGRITSRVEGGARP